MEERFIEIRVPGELADLLVADGLASIAVGRRSCEWGLLADFVGGAATTISLLQGPQTVAYLAHKCRTLATQRRERKGNDTQPLQLEAVGPKGQIRISLNAETSVAQIERLLRKTIFQDDPAD